MPLTDNTAYTLVKSAIEAGAFKLCGPSGTVEQAKKNADVDAAYLLALLEHLTKGRK